MLAKIRDAPTKEDMAWVEKFDQACQHVADHLTAFTDDVQRGLIP
jgi:hypothetical protein